MVWVQAFVALTVCAVAKWIWDRRTLYKTWQKLGIKGPNPTTSFFGNFTEVITEGRFKLLEEWTKKYGKVFGFYEGAVPTLVVADPDMIREIFIKQFHNFEHRNVVFDDSHLPSANMFLAKGDRWKRIRSLTTPTFSSKKMRTMSPLVHKSIDKLMKRFEQRVKDGVDFDICADFQCLTLDVIASTVFSYDCDVFNTNAQDSPFIQHIQKFFDNINPDKMGILTKIKFASFFAFPNLLKFIRLFIPSFAGPPTEWLENLAGKMIRDRQTTGEVRPDYIQLMLNSLNKRPGNESGSEGDTDLSEDETAKDTKQDGKKFLTMGEMEGQIVIFLAAGYETTATTLSFIAYYLALYPDIQAKLQQEIDEHFPIAGKNVSYETVQKLPYLEMVFCEVSRLAYIAQLAVQRMCKETTQVGDYTIPKGAKVLANVADIHMNLELWGPEPTDEFVPERFLPERKGARHPMAYLPFGVGPKNCIGMRFAIMEAKMTLINMLQRYTLVKCEKTQVPLKCNPDSVHGPADGVYVKLIKK